MGKQVRFFHNDEIEKQFLQRAREIGLQVSATSARAVALGFARTATPSPWLDGEFIEYSTDFVDNTARIWFDPLDDAGQPKSVAIREAYDALVRHLKRDSRFVSEHGLWVKKKHESEFIVASREDAKRTEELVRQNREYAVRVLGAKLKGSG